MKRLRIVFLVILALLLITSGATMAAQQEPAPDVIIVEKFGTTSIGGAGGETGDDGLAPIATEIQKPKRLGSSPLRTDPVAGNAAPLAAGAGSPTSSGRKAKSNPEIIFSFEGVNHRDN
ncbi:MAG TPA: hypothetical protein VF177_01525, partial [Anaerolineae bacterium]